MSSSQNPSTNSATELDVLIVGAGFAGVYQLYRFRNLGFRVLVLEAGTDIGGTWHWNAYPGVRVDTDLPIYQLDIPELWRDWSWKERFPGREELREYFRYVDEKLEIKKDVMFESRVSSAVWNNGAGKWQVKTEDGRAFRANFLSLCTGIGSKLHIPDFKGLESFQGEMHHTARWPENVDVKGKRVGILGTGATGVQVIQELGPICAHLTVFQRTPNLALPMRQASLVSDTEIQFERTKEELYPVYFARCAQTFGGYHYDIKSESTFSVSPEERTLYWESLFAFGGFRFWVANYSDVLTDQAANDAAYAFWRKKVCQRVHDPKMQELLAPKKPPHPFGTKRPSLEQSYYEVFNQDNVELVDIRKDVNPIEEITPKGVRTKDGVEHELDVLILATGFDMVTGGITAIDIRGTDGISIGEKWSAGVETYLGMTCATYPNMFWVYGPQGPTGFCNGPTCIGIQSNWVIDCIQHMKENTIFRIIPHIEAQDNWSKYIQKMSHKGLWSQADSWYMGANIPGKKREALSFSGGVPQYLRLIKEAAEKGYEGFELSAQTSRSS